MAAQRGQIEIVSGPDVWTLILAVFHGEKAHFKFGASEETLWHINGLWSNPSEPHKLLDVANIRFLDAERVNCEFTVMFPCGSATKSVVGVKYNVKTRKGTIDLTPICERNVLPWPRQ